MISKVYVYRKGICVYKSIDSFILKDKHLITCIHIVPVTVITDEIKSKYFKPNEICCLHTLGLLLADQAIKIGSLYTNSCRQLICCW